MKPVLAGSEEHVFEERRALLGKWFDKWTDSQRRRILTGLLERCSLSQQKFCCRKLQEKIPAEALDFTTKLPRVLSVYIFSFLDPRSLCRCAQVSWYWKSLAELDQLWMLKCLRFNWYISFSPTPFEQGVWKKHYIQMVRELHISKPKTPPKDGFIIADVQPISGSSLEEKPSPSLALRSSSALRKKTNPGEKELPPWRSSDKHPTDIIRFNYLDNCDPEHFWKGRRKRNEVTPDFKRQLREKRNRLEERARLRKTQSLGRKRMPSHGADQSRGLPRAETGQGSSFQKSREGSRTITPHGSCPRRSTSSVRTPPSMSRRDLLSLCP
ncbi:F-box only protein 16 isoform X7 [Onychomys torridus]|uniref:F-box only protein 16 isoform X7 n=1 Tax=Onychomys torridus TaxID=38674 RepID=UPI00167FB10B|nr:F-box only protein 16 isoform X7 [Onychomys torridus]XP_036054589.1 F-box only protein 16 isoform X7 [Onychomys torridus]